MIAVSRRRCRRPVTVRRLAREVGVPAWALYMAVRQNKLPHIRVGGAVLVPRYELNKRLAHMQSLGAFVHLWKEVTDEDHIN